MRPAPCHGARCAARKSQVREKQLNQNKIDRSLEVLGTADGGLTTCDNVGQELGVLLSAFAGHAMKLANALAGICTANGDAPAALLRAQDAATWMVRQPNPETRDAGIQLLVWLVGRGCAWAKYNLAVELTLGASLAPDFERANTLLHQAIRGAKGDAVLVAMACGALAENNAVGRGVPADRCAAQYWYERAAEFGNAEAAFNAALFYEDPAGAGRSNVAPDRLRAVYFYELAAQRLAVAKVKLAYLHLSGTFAGAEEGVGLQLLQEAARDGHAGAKQALQALNAL